MYTRKWTNKELKFIQDNYENLTDEQIATALNRSRAAIVKKRSVHGLSRKPRWTSNEDEIVRSHYGNMDKLLELLPGRSDRVIYERGRQLGLVAGKWSEDEDQILVDNWRNMSDEEISELLSGRGLHAVRQRRQVLDLVSCRRVAWTDEEETLLRQNYQLIESELVKLFPGRTVASVTSKRTMMGLSKNHSGKWTSDEDDFLAQNYLTMTNAEIAKTLGCSERAITNRKSMLKLRVRKSSVITESEKR